MILVFVLSDLGDPGSQRRFVGLQWCIDPLRDSKEAAILALDRCVEGFDREGLGPGELSFRLGPAFFRDSRACGLRGFGVLVEAGRGIDRVLGPEF